MSYDRTAHPFALRHRRKIMEAIGFSGKLLLFGVFVLACTVGPTLLLGWDTMLPAAIGIAFFALLLFSVVLMLPLELIAYVGPYFDRPMPDLPFPGFRFGRGLYRESARLDSMARNAGLPPLSDFESPDVLDSREPPVWHRPEAALPTVDYLLSQVNPQLPVHRDLLYVQAALRAAHGKGACFYFLLLTWAGFTNAEVEARRRGDLP